MSEKPVVGIVMGSAADRGVMAGAGEILREFGVPYEEEVISAHRQPARCAEYGSEAAGRGLRVLIAGAGAAAALPGVLAAHTPLPVIGVPIASTALSGLDALFAIAQMPSGVPVGAVAIDGAKNAALLAVRILALSDRALAGRVQEHRDQLAKGS